MANTTHFAPSWKNFFARSTHEILSYVASTIGFIIGPDQTVRPRNGRMSGSQRFKNSDFLKPALKSVQLLHLNRENRQNSAHGTVGVEHQPIVGISGPNSYDRQCYQLILLLAVGLDPPPKKTACFEVGPTRLASSRLDRSDRPV
ncbi:hypothetical protein COLO4_08107 [Corchorus olitorius]|uniref:Uncharacterized protein n=1 Tax=Corchorus olitorius TaxID=93759 RepID=A0A1R3KHD0_9ROSI|nr:hypothetical protein COLO4_08107 [Corchorus olitorius]